MIMDLTKKKDGGYGGFGVTGFWLDLESKY
jgi:hypothetical protein